MADLGVRPEAVFGDSKDMLEQAADARLELAKIEAEEAAKKSPRRWFSPMSPVEKAAQAAFLGLGATDWGQTIRFTQDPAYREAHPRAFESNPVLGKHPSRSKVNLLVPLGLAAHTLGAWALPRPYRNILQAVGIGLEGEAVLHNDMRPQWPWK